MPDTDAESGARVEQNDDDRYIICKYCEGHEDGWSVKVDQSGGVTALECRDCGGSDWYRRSW